ncbi:hypothetical protein Tco_0218850 [Tanacetum coccineum]
MARIAKVAFVGLWCGVKGKGFGELAHLATQLVLFDCMDGPLGLTLLYQKEVNEIRAEKIARNANPLALVAAAQQYPDPYYQA